MAPPVGSRRGLCPWLTVSRLRRELLHPRLLPLLHFIARETFFARRDRPPEPLGVDDRSGAIAPELIPQLPHEPACHLRTRRHAAVEQRVAILHIVPEPRRCTAERFLACATA